MMNACRTQLQPCLTSLRPSALMLLLQDPRFYVNNEGNFGIWGR